MKTLKLVSLSVLFALPATESFAAPLPPNVSPGSVSPAQVMQNITANQPQKAQKEETPLVNDDTSSKQSAQKHTIQAHFMLKQVEIVGAPTDSTTMLQALYQPLLMQDTNLKSLQNLAATMQAALRQEGYLLAQVVLPPQTIDKQVGLVQLQVIPGQIAQVRFHGDATHGATNQLQRHGNKIAGQNPATLANLDEELNLMNELPGITARGVLRPSQTPLAADLDVDIQQKSVGGYVAYNNRGTDYIGPNQLSAGFYVNDIVAADHFAVNYATSTPHPNELSYFNTSYSIIPFASGTKITPSITYTDTKPGEELATFNMTGRSTRYALDVSQPLSTSSLEKISLLGGMYHLDSKNDFSNFQLYDDQITAFDLGLSYDGLLLGGSTDGTFVATQGIPVLGAHRAEADPSRNNGTADFTKFNIDLSHTHYLSTNTSVVGATSMQYSNDPLLVSEQIGYGGTSFGQAYDPSEIIGDSGMMGSIALRYDLPQSFTDIPLLQPFAFYDIGKVWTNETTGNPATAQSGASTGVGFNATLTQTWQTTFTLAYPLTLTPQEQSHRDWRAFFSVVGVF